MLPGLGRSRYADRHRVLQTFPSPRIERGRRGLRDRLNAVLDLE